MSENVMSPQVAGKLGPISAYALRWAQAHYMTGDCRASQAKAEAGQDTVHARCKEAVAGGRA